MDLDDVLEIPPLGPLPTTTFGARGRSDADLPPARKAKVTPITTGKSMTDRFKELPRIGKPKPKAAAAGVRMVPKQSSVSQYKRDVNGATAAAFSRTIKSYRQHQAMHMQEMMALQEVSRRKHLESQQLRIGNVRVVGARGSVHERTGLLASINQINTIIRNRTKAELSSQIRTAQSLNLRLGVPRNPSNSSNRSIVQFQREDIMRGRGFVKDLIGRCDIRRGAAGHQGTGISSTMAKRNSAGFNNGNFTCKDELDHELDEYMTKARQSRKNLDKELEEYMAAAAAAKKKKNADTEVIPEVFGFEAENDTDVQEATDDVDKPDSSANAEMDSNETEDRSLNNGVQNTGVATSGGADNGNNGDLMDLDW